MDKYLFIRYKELSPNFFKKTYQKNKKYKKVFLFISNSIENIPFSTIHKLQQIAKKTIWLKMDTIDLNENIYMAISISSLHEKTKLSTKFEILTNFRTLEPIISYFKYSKRKITTFYHKNTSRKQTIKTINTNDLLEEHNLKRNLNEIDFREQIHMDHINSIPTVIDTSPIYNQTYKPNIIEKIATDLLVEPILDEKEIELSNEVKKVLHLLDRSGNRPSNLELLEYYIQTTCTGNFSANMIIDHSIKTKKITIKDQIVSYNFN